MPTENRSNTEMVSVPREWLNSVALLQMPLDQLQEQAVEFLCEPCDEPAEQHQGEPVAWRVEIDGMTLLRFLPSLTPRAINTPLSTHADPGEVERLRAELEQFKIANARLSMSNVDRRNQNAELSAQLAERDALLVKANYVIDHARTIDKQAFGRGAQNVDPGLFRGLGNLLAQYDEALSASAEPSAPKCGKCAGSALVQYPEHAGAWSDCPECKPSAPVERDERAEFEACFDRTLKEQEAGLEHYQVSTMRFGKEVMWEGWKARAALERKPS